MFTDINSEDRLVQATFAEHLEKVLGWESVYAYNQETFGPDGTLGRGDQREVVLTRDLRAALGRLNPQLPPAAVEAAVSVLTPHAFHHNAFLIVSNGHRARYGASPARRFSSTTI